MLLHSLASFRPAMIKKILELWYQKMSSISLASQNENLRQGNAAIREGVARLTFDTDVSGNTRLKNLYQSDPQRVLFPNSPDKDIIQAAVVNISGGLVGGDKLLTRVKVNKNASVFVVGQSAEKVYRSKGPDSEIEINLTVEDGSWLEFLPQETILFNDSRLRRRTHIDIEGDAELIAGELLVFGRLGHGERFQSGLIHDAWEITKDGRLIWADALHMEDDIASTIADPACFDGAGIDGDSSLRWNRYKK